MKITRFFILSSMMFHFGCTNPSGDKVEIISEIEAEKGSPNSSATYTQDDQGNIRRLIELTLTDLFKEDLEKGFIDSLGRQFKYSLFDLNQDGSHEIFVGLTSSFFCGSGGCTILLVTGQGDLITKFTVVDYPLYVDPNRSNGWNNLVMYSGKQNRLVKFNGQKYPSNPSILEVYTGNVDMLTKLLDWEIQESYPF